MSTSHGTNRAGPAQTPAKASPERGKQDVGRPHDRQVAAVGSVGWAEEAGSSAGLDGGGSASELNYPAQVDGGAEQPALAAGAWQVAAPGRGAPGSPASWCRRAARSGLRQGVPGPGLAPLPA